MQRLTQDGAVGPGREDDHETFGRKIGGREEPPRLPRRIIRERPAVQVHRAGAGVVYLDPVRVLAVFVGERFLVVRHELADDHLRGGRTGQHHQTNHPEMQTKG